MIRSGFVGMIVRSGLVLGQLAALPAAADDAAARRQALEPYFRNYRPSGPQPTRKHTASTVAQRSIATMRSSQRTHWPGSG